MSAAPGEGTTLSVTITATPTVIAEVVSIDPPELSRPKIDTSHLFSTIRTNRVGLLDPGELTLVINYDPGATTHAYLTTSVLAGLLEAWLITFADAGGATWGFSGHVTSFKPDGVAVDSNLTATVKVALTTTITITP